jgi:hypothetical protein
MSARRERQRERGLAAALVAHKQHSTFADRDGSRVKHRQILLTPEEPVHGEITDQPFPRLIVAGDDRRSVLPEHDRRVPRRDAECTPWECTRINFATSAIPENLRREIDDIQRLAVGEADHGKIRGTGRLNLARDEGRGVEVRSSLGTAAEEPTKTMPKAGMLRLKAQIAVADSVPVSGFAAGSGVF